MIEEFTVQHEDGPTRGRYVVYLQDGLEAELTYGKRDETTIIADHTFVPPAYRGLAFADVEIPLTAEGARRGQIMFTPKVEARITRGAPVYGRPSMSSTSFEFVRIARWSPTST